MGSLVLYIMEWAFALIVLLTIYKATFSGTTFYRFNRFYLLGATVLSALLPLVHITIPDKTPIVSDMAIGQMEFAQELTGTFIFMGEPAVTEMTETEPTPSAGQSSLWAVILVCMYSAYVLMLLVGWVRSIMRAKRFLRGKPRRRISRTVWLVTHDEDFGPFSWMNYIVISDTENGFSRRASLRHEYSHIKLYHSVDLVFLLACTILNPVCWLVLQEIKIVHEYEADNEVINRYGIRNSDYQKLLIMRTVGAEAYALASSFNLNIKKRIIMLNKNQTRKSRLMWLLLLIPLLGMTSVLFARTEKSIGPDDVLNLSPSNENDGKEYVENSSYEISGKVVDKDGNPIALAQFAVLPELSGMATLTKCVSDLKGVFAFSAQKGDVVTVSKDGYKSIKINVDKPSSDLTVTLEKTKEQQPKLKSGEIIQGVVIDASHGEAPIMLADVYELDRDERIRAHAITDMEGNFIIRIVDPDDFIKVSNKGYQSALSEIKKDLKIRLVEVKTEPENNDKPLTRVDGDSNTLKGRVIGVKNTEMSSNVGPWIYIYNTNLLKDINQTECELDESLMMTFLSSIAMYGETSGLDDVNPSDIQSLQKSYRSALEELQVLQKKGAEEMNAMTENMPTGTEQEMIEAQRKMQQKYQEIQRKITERTNELIGDLSTKYNTVLMSIGKNYQYVCINSINGTPSKEIIAPSDNLEDSLKDLFEERKGQLAIPFTDANYQQIKSLLTDKYVGKKVFFMNR